MSDTDAAEANRRAEWLHKHKAPKDWIVLTTSEVSVIREELLAVERERNSARAKFVAAIDGRDMANEEADKLREQNAKLREETITYWKERERIALNAASEHSESASKLHRRAQRVEAQNAKLRDIAEKALDFLSSCGASETEEWVQLHDSLDQLKEAAK